MASYGKICEICSTNPVDTNLCCGHYFCTPCLNMYLFTKITDDQIDLICPSCKTSLTYDEIKYFTTEELLFRYRNTYIAKQGLNNESHRQYFEHEKKGFRIFISLEDLLFCDACSNRFIFKRSKYPVDSIGNPFWCRIYENGVDDKHSYITCLVGRKINDCYWSSIFVFLFFPISYFFLFYFAIWYKIESNDAPYECCVKHKLLNKLLAFVVSPLMGFIFWPFYMTAMFMMNLIKESFGCVYFISICCYACVIIIIILIVYPICIALYLALGVIGSVLLPVLGLFLLIFKLVNILKSSH